MAATGEVPFALYYGGVDTTPLFIVLAGAYVARTGDVGLIDELWPALERAAKWVAGVCDKNRFGLLDYQRASDGGLANQGWKDSHDSVFHADGRFPDGPDRARRSAGVCERRLRYDGAVRGAARPDRGCGALHAARDVDSRTRRREVLDG